MNLKELIAFCDDLPNNEERKRWLDDTGVHWIIVNHVLRCYPE